MSRPLLSTLAALCALGLPIALHAPAAQADADTPATTASAPAARVIVKLKSDSSLRRMQALSVGERHASQAQALGLRVGIAMTGGAGIDDRTQVMFASGMSSDQLAAKLATDANVESVSVDHRRRRTAVPNDPLYLSAGGTGPAVGQWYLRPQSATAPAAINAEAAWDLTTGSSSIVVAVLDTGVRFDHVDLARVAASGNLLPGYDMIADVATANDGDGRDADPSDPGDWVTATESANGAFQDCTVENSSWHGTQTAGLIGATTNNAVGMASVGRTVRVLPVRVLGKCGGYDSDIQAAMRWAAGLSVPGVPANPNPARVINMSLGGTGSCGSYNTVVNEVTAAGVVVVASGGNTAGHAVNVPANCANAIGVGGIRHVGSKVGFSDLGPELTISAPAGNCVNTGANDACLYPILTTSNSGTQGPVVGGSIYTDSFNSSLGTSFSAPLVSGTVALMLSVRPAMTPAEVKAMLRSTARPFPTTGASNAPDPTPVAQCTAPQFNNQGQPIDQLQCYCTTSTCGAGMLDTAAAVSALTAPLTAVISATPTSAAVGQAIALSAAGSTAAAGRTLSYDWSVASGTAGFVGSSVERTLALVTTVPGSVTVRLVVTDNTGATATTTQTVTFTALPAVETGGGGGGGAIDATWLLALGAATWGVRRRR